MIKKFYWELDDENEIIRIDKFRNTLKNNIDLIYIIILDLINNVCKII